MENGHADPICAEVAACAADDEALYVLMNSNHGCDVAIHAMECEVCDSAIGAFYKRNPPEELAARRRTA